MSFYERIQKWRTDGLRNEDGILVGAEISQEWMLPWWWENYRKHNPFPVAFADFGMSARMQSWCAERGEVIAVKIPDCFVAAQDELDPRLAAEWLGGRSDTFWDIRPIWFKKPFACLQTPFQRTIWIDIDCEIRDSLTELFSCCENPNEIAMGRYNDASIYNAGVIPFKRGNRIFSIWASESLKRNHLFRSDQELLVALLAELNISIQELSRCWNWSRKWAEESDIKIYHWHGEPGKAVIYSMIDQF